MNIQIYNKKEFYSYFKINEYKKWWDYFLKNFKYFMFPIPESSIFFVLFDDNNIPVWIAELLKQTLRDILELPDTSQTITLSLCYLTIHPKHRWKWYSTKILEKIISSRILKEAGLFYSSYFTDDWKNKLKSNMIKLCNKKWLKLYVSWEGLLN